MHLLKEKGVKISTKLPSVALPLCGEVQKNFSLLCFDPTETKRTQVKHSANIKGVSVPEHGQVLMELLCFESLKISV